MRPDQIARLLDLQERLADVVLEEADPAEWPGAGIPLADMSKEDRGNRYWSKKNAAATFALLERTTSTIERTHPAGTPPKEVEDDMDKQIAQREREAEAMLGKALSKAKKAAFDDHAPKG